MKKSELPFLIAAALRFLGAPYILGLSVDGGHDSELMIDASDEAGRPVTFVIRSKGIDEEEPDEE